MNDARRRVVNVDSKPLVTGILFLSRLAFLREQGGSALEQVLAYIGRADAAVLRGTIVPDAWYPLGLHHRMDEAIAAVFSEHDRADVLVQLGRASADEMLAGSEYIKHGAPEFFLNAVPRLYSAHHTAGRRDYQSFGPNAGVIRAFDTACFARRDDCWTAMGWLQRALELCGADGVLVNETACRAAGAPCCEYHCEWHSVIDPPPTRS